MSTLEQREAMRAASATLNAALQQQVKELRWARQRRNNQRNLARVEHHAEVAASLGLLPMPTVEGDFRVPSHSRPGFLYEMNETPEGYVVHQGEGCQGEIYRGPIGCRHSREYTDMTALVPAQTQAIAARQQFSPEDVQVIKNTICRGSTDAELGMFLATCRSTGLNPFMHQIWAIMRNVNVGSSQSPKYEKQMQIQIGIDGYRVVRDRLTDRDGNPFFDGMEGPQWSKDGVNWLDAWTTTAPPAVARVAIYRKGISRPFVAQARWDAYNQGNSMWKTMGAEQLAKCAEALALRRAFPADMGALPSGSIAELEPPSLSDLPEPVAALIEELPTAGEYRDIPEAVCEHEAVFDEKLALLVCSKCAVALEEPDGPSQKPLV